MAALCVVLALVTAQVAVPTWAGFHDWPFAAVLAAAMAVVARIKFRGAGRAMRTELGSRPNVTVIGALVIGATGLAQSLLGPDPQVVRRAPGTVAVVSEVDGAAFFPAVGADAIARGDAAITLRRRAGSRLVLPADSSAYLGATLLQARAAAAAYLQVQDESGQGLTLTQPTNPSFLSPVALFPQNVPIAGRSVPADSFAVPARHRVLRVFYFEAGTLPGPSTKGHDAAPAVLFVVDDDAGHVVAHGIAAARSGQTMTLGGLRLRATLGTYPALVVASIPAPVGLWLGLALLLAALGLPVRLR